MKHVDSLENGGAGRGEGASGSGFGAPALTTPGLPTRSGGERSEPQRRGGSPGVAAPESGITLEREDPEVSVRRPRKRKLTAAYKLEILRQADACSKRGELGALLRREGLYSSHLVSWRRQGEEGALGALSPRKRGRKAKPVDPSVRRVTELEREIVRLQKRLDRAEVIIAFQKKVSELMGTPLSLPESEND